jgi:hypothetical protein
MKTPKTAQATLSNSLTLLVAACMAIGTIALCCAFCYTEGCDPSVTLDVDENPVCDGNSVGASALTTCDDEDDIVKVINSIQPETQLTYNQIVEGHLLWDGTIPLGVGLNKLKATAGECERVSSEVDVPCNGGSSQTWVFELTTNSPNGGLCGFVYNVVGICLPDGNNYDAWEDHTDDDPCGFLSYTEYDPASGRQHPISSAGLMIIPDQNAGTCPPYQSDQSNCDTSNTKNWVVQNRITLATYYAPSETVTFTHKMSTPGLTIVNSQVGTYASPH